MLNLIQRGFLILLQRHHHNHHLLQSQVISNATSESICRCIAVASPSALIIKQGAAPSLHHLQFKIETNGNRASWPIKLARSTISQRVRQLVDVACSFFFSVCLTVAATSLRSSPATRQIDRVDSAQVLRYFSSKAPSSLPMAYLDSIIMIIIIITVMIMQTFFCEIIGPL